jgi:hypothetical protein
MIKKPALVLLPFLILVLLVLRAQVARDTPPPAYDPSLETVIVRFGVTGKTPQDWSGSIDPDSSSADVISLSGYHFEPQDHVEGHSFQLRSRAWNENFFQTDLSPARPGPRAVFPNGVYAILKSGPGAKYRLRVNNQSYTFTPAGASFADGNIEVERTHTQFDLTAGASGESDFPALAANRSGRMAAVWQEYHNGRDALVIREFDGSRWLATQTISSEETRDAYRPTAAYDNEGTLHVVWAGQVNGYWNLFWRANGTIQRITTAQGPDLNAKMISDAAGNLWVAWQAFRDGQSAIYIKQFRQGAWGAEIKVSESAANEWEPALAAAPDGTVWVGWDGYDRGNYDVFVRPIRQGKPGPVRTVTTSPRFQAHVSLAADAQNRLWIAFDEAEANWGKDYGYLVKDKGNPLYQSRRLRLARLAEGKLEEPAASIDEAFPLGTPVFLQYGQLGIDSQGQPTIVAMQLTHSYSVVEVWGARGVWEEVVLTLDGDHWKRGRVLPDSQGAHEIRATLAKANDGSLWAAWAADARNFGQGRPEHQTVRVAHLLSWDKESQEARMKPFVDTPAFDLATHPNEAKAVAAIRGYEIRSEGKVYKIVRGDLHRHTSLSGDGVGDGSLWDLYRYELDAAALDFSTVTDHQGGQSDYDWWKIQKSVDLFYLPGRLTTIYAYERSLPYPNGHRNIIFPKRGAPILPIPPDERDGKVRSSDAVLPYLRKYNALAFRHTTATDQGTDWKDHNNELEPLVEIYQGHRDSYEHEGAPKAPTAEKDYLHRSGYRPDGFIWNALKKGYRFGFEAASDHTSTHISYSCILTPDLSRDGIIASIRQRHSYGATDNIVLDFRVKTGGKEFLQGDEVKTSGSYTMSVNVIGTGPIRRIDLIHNETYAYNLEPTGKSSASFSYADPSPFAGENRYYIRVLQEDGNIAWSSPVWVVR